MTDKKSVWETVVVDIATAEEDEEFLTFRNVVTAREGVQQYSDGRAYKPAKELERYAPFANGWAVAGSHPENPYKLLINVDDIAGETFNSRFVKDLHDPKTGRNNIRGVRTDLRIWKNKVDLDLLEALRSGKKNDVSVGFIAEQDRTPGTWNGQDYDYSQINIFPDHLAFGIMEGRCPSPFCGLAADEVLVADEDGMVTFEMTIHVDHMEGMREFIAGFPVIGGDKMEDAEIDKKIEELKAQKEELRDRVDEYHKAQEPEEEDSEISKLYEQIDEISAQIEAYIEAKVIKEVISDEGDNPQGEGDPQGEGNPPELCECMGTWAEKFPEAFAALPEGHTVVVPEKPDEPVKTPINPTETILRAKRMLKQ